MSALDFTHRFIPAEGESQRVLLLLHGTGGDEHDLLPLGRQLDPHAALLSPRGKVLENGMPRWFRRFAEGVFDEEDVIRRAHELADFITSFQGRAVCNRPGRLQSARPCDLVALGSSNGANNAAAMLFLRPEVLSRAILLRAVPLSKPPAADLTGKQVLINAGGLDPIIPPENAQSLAALLQQRGAEVQLEVQPASHGLIAALALARRWLGR